MNLNGEGGGHIYLDGYILKSVRVSIGQTPCSLSIILFFFCTFAAVVYR